MFMVDEFGSSREIQNVKSVIKKIMNSYENANTYFSLLHFGTKTQVVQAFRQFNNKRDIDNIVNKLVYLVYIKHI